MSTHIPSSQTTEDDSFRTVINEYQGFLFHQAMAPSNIECCLRRSRHFLIWLSRNGLGLSEVDGEVAARFQTHDCTCYGRSCARSKLRPARTAAGSSSFRVMWFVRFLELSGRTPTPGELEDNLARVPAFLHELRRQGYSQSRVDRFRYGATAFIAWLHLSRMRLRDIDADTLERFHHRRFACSIPGICWGRRSEKERRYGPDIQRFLDHLADTGQIEPWRRALGPHRECFAGFRAWLARTRDISAGGINDYIKQIQAVLPALGEVPESYDAALIRRVMLAHLERGSRSRARVLATSLRMYLRFLAFEGHVPAALVGAVPSVPAWSLSTLPRHILVEDVERTIESCDTATPVGTRDRAALLLLARLALRAGDVVALRLTDIDWDRALLRVNGKTRRDTLLPLPQDVGDALHAYIASARPRIDEPRVFLAVNAPFRPISGPGVVSAIARRAFERAGVVPPATRGAHTMRHSAATGWLRAGMPMEAIRVLLRHRSSSTTAIYAKVDHADARRGRAALERRACAMTLIDHVARYVALKRRLGYDYRTHAGILRQYARFADDRGDSVVRTATVTEWASAAVSRHQAARRLHFVHAFAVWMRAEDARHEVPPRGLFGPHSNQRPPPDLMTTQEVRALLAAALRLGPTGTISPLTWHYMLGLIASTGIRRCEAVALRLTDVTPHGLVIRESKFRKSRLVTLHPSTTEALDAYLAIRRAQATPDDHLFVLDRGRVPGPDAVTRVFRKLAIQTGIRTGTRRPRVHDLRHRFATRSLEALDATEDPARHMLALATYLGHVDPVSTYWYLEASPVLLRDIAEATERTFTTGGGHD